MQPEQTKTWLPWTSQIQTIPIITEVQLWPRVRLTWIQTWLCPLLAEIWAGHLNYPSLSFFSCKMGCPNHLTSGSNLSPRADLKVLCEGESLHCSPKTITALLISYTPQYKIKSSKFKKFYVKPPRPAACLADTKSTNKVDQIHFGHYFCFSSP